MTTAKLASKMSAGAASALGPHVEGLYEHPGRRVVAVVELCATERVQVADGEEKDGSVTLTVKQMELPADERQDEALRDAMLALYRHRTAAGTLDAHGDVQLSERTIADTGGRLDALEAARLRAGLRSLDSQLGQVLGGMATPVDLRRGIEQARRQLDQLAGWGDE